MWGVAAKLAKHRPSNAAYASRMAGLANAWVTGSNGVSITPKGLAWGGSVWGALRHTGNALFVLLAHARASLAPDSTARLKIECLAHSQLSYILGDAGRSYVVGYGVNPPLSPHHRGSSCSRDRAVPCGWAAFNAPGPNPAVLYGALVGGPDSRDAYVDKRSDYIANEVAVDYNSGYTGGRKHGRVFLFLLFVVLGRSSKQLEPPIPLPLSRPH